MSKTSRRRKSRHKSRKINKRMRNNILRIGTIVVAVVFAVILGILIPQRDNEDTGETLMSKEYTPGEEVARSLLSNQSLNKDLEDESLNSNQEDITNDTSILATTTDAGSSTSLVNDPASTDTASADTASTEIGSNDTASADTASTDTGSDDTASTDTGSDDTASTDTASTDTVSTETRTSNNSSQTEDNEATQGADAGSSGLVDENQTAVLGEGDIPEGMTKEEEIQYVKDQWVNDMIYENRDSIEDTDLSVGASIYNQIDTNYLFGLAEGGLTEEENAEAMAYLEANLSDDQIELAKVLFNKYIGLVE